MQGDPVPCLTHVRASRQLPDVRGWRPCGPWRCGRAGPSPGEGSVVSSSQGPGSIQEPLALRIDPRRKGHQGNWDQEPGWEQEQCLNPWHEDGQSKLGPQLYREQDTRQVSEISLWLRN